MNFQLKIGYYTRIRYSVIITIALVATCVRYLVLPEFSWQMHIMAFFVQILDLGVIWESIRLINKYLNTYIPFEKNLRKRITIQVIIVLIMATLLAYAILQLVDRVAPAVPTKPFVIVFSVTTVLLLLSINIGYIGAYFFDQWKMSLLRSAELEKEKSTVQYQNLINQLNPHFFFNSLTSLNSLIFKDQDLASRFLQQLSRVYRYMLDNKDKELVSLKTEVGFVNNYIQLLKTRFGEGIEVQINISEGAGEKLIVPVTLQIMIENAIKHNIVDMDSPLVVEISDAKDVLIVRNNIQAKMNIETSNKLGLESFKALYSYLSATPVEISDSDNIFTVKIPLLCQP